MALGTKTRVRIFVFLLSLSASILVLISTDPHGIALSPDSVGYISVARSLAAGDGLTLYSSAALTLWPPVYPLIRSLPDVLFGDDPLTGSRIRHAVLAGLIVYLSGLLFERHIATSPCRSRRSRGGVVPHPV